jgi:hypothetical protein
MFTTTSTYAPLATDPSTRAAAKPHGRTVRRGLVFLLAALAALLAVGGWESRQPESRTQELLQQTGLVKPDLGLGQVSAHRELVTVVLNVGSNDHGILEVVRSLLAMTVGPYELIGTLRGMAARH